MMTRSLISAAGLLFSGSALLAQAAYTGTGGGPLTTQTAPNTTTTGRTKPPSRVASRTPADPLLRPVRSASPQDGATRGICVGCGLR